MFRFIHAADIHLDSPLKGLEAKEGAPVDQIRGATRVAFSRIIDLCLQEEVSFLLIAGDLYDGAWRDYSTGLFFNAELKRLQAKEIQVYLISGNHDAESKITSELRPPENVYTFPVTKPNSVRHSSLPVILHGQGFETAVVTTNLATAYPERVDSHFNIGLLHCSLGDKVGSSHATYAPCSLQDLRDKGYDYWALGHIHQTEVIATDPHIVYSGNPQGRHFNETGPRGCYLVDVDDELAVSSCQFLQTNSVLWEHITIDASDCVVLADLTDLLEAQLPELSSTTELLCLRCTLTGQTGLHGRLRTEPDALSAVLHDAFSKCETPVWLEKVRLETRPVLDRHQLAQQSDAARIIIERLEHAEEPRPSDKAARLLKSLDEQTKELLKSEPADWENFVLTTLEQKEANEAE